ncbi:MAG TPA: diacylglycerol kinase family protein [Tepidisphaeraceae bacterium]
MQKIAPPLRAEGFDVEVVQEHPARFDRQTTPDPIHAVIVIGGDGTLRAVIERLTQIMAADALPPVLVIGLGTANLMQQHLRLRYSPETLAADVCDLLRKPRITRVDAALAGEHLFLLMASCGFDATVVHHLSAKRTGPITKLSYLAPALAALRDFSLPRLRVEVDGIVLCSDQPGMVFVGNVAEYGTGFPVLDRANSFDGLLDVCVMRCDSLPELAQLSMLTLVGQHHTAAGVHYVTGKNVAIEGTTAPVQVDGEAAGTTPVRIRLLEHGVPFIVR